MDSAISMRSALRENGLPAVTTGVLIHDDTCGRVYVYLDGRVALDWGTYDPTCCERVARALEGVGEAIETQGSVIGCGRAPERLDEWSGLEPIERDGDESLRGIIAAFAVGVVAVLAFSDEYIFGEDLFFPDDIPGW